MVASIIEAGETDANGTQAAMHQVAAIGDGLDSAEVLNNFQQAFSHLDDADTFSERGPSIPDVLHPTPLGADEDIAKGLRRGVSAAVWALLPPSAPMSSTLFPPAHCPSHGRAAARPERGAGPVPVAPRPGRQGALEPAATSVPNAAGVEANRRDEVRSPLAHAARLLEHTGSDSTQCHMARACTGCGERNWAGLYAS